jgi:hypothetical protein
MPHALLVWSQRSRCSKDQALRLPDIEDVVTAGETVNVGDADAIPADRSTTPGCSDG